MFSISAILDWMLSVPGKAWDFLKFVFKTRDFMLRVRQLTFEVKTLKTEVSSLQEQNENLRVENREKDERIAELEAPPPNLSNEEEGILMLISSKGSRGAPIHALQTLSTITENRIRLIIATLVARDFVYQDFVKSNAYITTEGIAELDRRGLLD